MTFIVGLYVGISLVIGLALTYIAWEEDRKARMFETAITFIGMICCFAAIWPGMALALILPERK